MVKFINRLIDGLLYTSLFTACCATGLCMATERLIDLSVLPLFTHLHLLVFGSTLLIYNAPRLVRPARATERSATNYRNEHLFFFCAGAVMAMISLYFMPLQIAVTAVFLSIFAFAYFLPILPFKNRKRLRDFGWLKIFVLAGVWTTATSILPILYLDKSISDYPFEILLRLVFIFTLCVVFDIRDMQTDLENKIYTLPHKVGLHNSYKLINAALLLFVYLSVVQYIRYPAIERLVGVLVTAITTKLVVYYLKKHPSERGYLVLADGVMLVYALLVLIPYSR
jgi:4-hydroxybenzoate polyprenyltransferase